MSSIARLSAFPHVAREIMQQFKGQPVHLIGLTGTNSRMRRALVGAFVREGTLTGFF